MRRIRDSILSSRPSILSLISIKPRTTNSSRSNSNSNSPIPTLLTLPLELRLLIYTYLFNSNSKSNSQSPTHALSNPHTNPLTTLLHIHNKQLHHEVSSFLYTTSLGFTFLNTRHTLAFLLLTTSHVHLLRNLTVSVAHDDTFALERVFRGLVENSGGGGGGLRRLVLKLVCVESFRGRDGDGSESMELRCRRGQGQGYEREMERVLREARTWAGRVEGRFGRGLEELEGRETGERIGRERCGSFLGRMSGLRSFKAVKRPLEGSTWAVEFEIAVLRVWMCMFKVAAGEGKCVRRANEKGYMERYWWGNEVWIDGEERD